MSLDKPFFYITTDRETYDKLHEIADKSRKNAMDVLKTIVDTSYAIFENPPQSTDEIMEITDDPRDGMKTTEDKPKRGRPKKVK